MKNFTLSFCIFLVSMGLSFAQSPTVYCTFWDGTSESMAHLNFSTNTVDPIGVIPGSTIFPVAQANGYDSYRNRYYTISNQGLVAVDASTGSVVNTAAQFAGSFKHLSYNPTTDLLFATRYNGTEEEFFQISPETFQIVNSGVLNIGTPMFVVGFYGSDAFANEVIFQTSTTLNGIKTVNMATGQVTKTFNKPAYLANVLLATHDPLTDLYYATGLRNTKLYLLQINKTTGLIDSIGQIPGATAVGLAGSAIDVVNRKYIFVSNLGITVVSLDNPANTIVIPYPPGVSNVKGFQTNYFSAPLPRVQGSNIRAQFKNVEAWLKDGVELSNTASAEFTPTESGNYSYRVRRTDGTTSLSSEVAFSVTSSNSKTSSQDFQLLYDYTSDKLSIQVSGSDVAEFLLYNSAGQNLHANFSDKKELNTQNLVSGVYQVVVQQNGKRYSKRFVKP